MKNKKGFTLIELIAVIVILILIILLAVNYVKKYTQSSKEKALTANAISYVKASNLLSTSLRGTNNEILNGIFSTADMNTLGVKVDGTSPSSGYVVFNDFEVSCACLQYKKSIAKFKDGEYTANIKGKCNIDKPICTYVAEDVVLYPYTGEEQIYTIPADGVYKLEVWGAQGGHIDETFYGGYGGYSVGEIELNQGDKLYINVGGAGVVNGEGGYNGGGDSNIAGAGSGGGATSIAFISGKLSSLENKKDDILIVAGGGGGAKYYQYTNYSDNLQTHDYSGAGGSGGGYIGGAGIASNSVIYGVGLGGTQTEGGSVQVVLNANGSNTGLFGKGVSPNYYTGSGSGAGLYGGGTIEHGPAGGGSGYIANELLTNKRMYCYNCQESSDESTRTTTTTCESATPTENCVKRGNGYARITNMNSSSGTSVTEKNFYQAFGGYTKVEYIQSHGTEVIQTTITPNSDMGIDVTFEALNDYTASSTYYIIGSKYDSNHRYMLATKNNSSNNAVFFGMYNESYNYNQDLTGKVNVKLMNSSLSINNVVRGYISKAMTSSNAPLSIFALNNNGTIQEFGSYKLYDLSIYQGGDKIAHFIPCISNKDNEIGLCETFSGKFYKNNALGTFEMGDKENE